MAQRRHSVLGIQSPCCQRWLILFCQMTAMRTLLKIIGSLALMGGWLWLVAAACNHVWPEAKWFFIAASVGIWLFILARQFVRKLDDYQGAIDAYLRRRIDTENLPSDFRSITHANTLQDVIDEFGPSSRAINLAVPTEDGRREDFVAYEYDLPYEAAVIVIPERPCKPENNIRAICFRRRPDEDEVFAPGRL